MNVPSGKSADSPSRSPRARKGKDTAISASDALRERILEAALRSFSERGFHGTSVPEIARAARVGVGSIYRHFDSKERLVNAVFREAKTHLRDALLLDFDLGRAPDVMFADVWSRLVRFQREQPVAFQFLEMQDHVPYLDGESRAVEASVLAPLLFAVEAAIGSGPSGVSPAMLIAMVWGSFVGLTKAERLGYLTLDDAMLRSAGEVCFAAFAASLLPAPKTERKRTRTGE